MSQPSFDLDIDTDDGGNATFSVRELADAINGSLRHRFAEGIWVRGEIQGWNERGPHAYFRLVEDGDDGKAVVNVQFFANTRARLRPLLSRHRLHLADGLNVRLFGHLDFFAPSGQLGLKMAGIDPRFTLGDLALQRDDVVRRLVAGGLFDANRQTSVALAPLRIGVVTSIDSAAWADFSHELQRSGRGFRVEVINVRVQGEWAITEITAALQSLGRRADIDVIALIRGGGSKTELATFDHESIATAIAASQCPVFTGLGHEIDRSVADDVAHSAFKTPTACAVDLVERVNAFVQRTESTWLSIQHRASSRLTADHVRLAQLHDAIDHRTVSALERSAERLQQRVMSFVGAAQRSCRRATTDINTCADALRRSPRLLDHERRHLDQLAERVRLLDPVHTMARGWSITRDADGTIVRDAATLAVGDSLTTHFATGTARSTVQETST